MGGKLGYKLTEGVTASLLSLPSDSEVNSVRLAVTPEVSLPELPTIYLATILFHTLIK